MMGTFLKPADSYAEVSADGGGSWSTVVEVHNGNATFFSGTVSSTGLDDKADVQLGFRATGHHNGDYCWGDNVTVTGPPDGGDPEPDIAYSGKHRLLPSATPML